MSDPRLSRLAALGAATVHEAQARTGALDPAIRPVWSSPAIAAPAFTVRCAPGDNLAVHRALEAASEGDLLLVQAEGDLAGCWGELTTVAAQVRGIVGLVIDGGVRDAQAIEDRGFPIWSRGIAIRGTVKADPGSSGEPITIGGVAARTGDIVIADRDGVVVVPVASLDAALAAAEAREAKERAILERIEAGELTLDLLDLRGRD